MKEFWNHRFTECQREIYETSLVLVHTQWDPNKLVTCLVVHSLLVEEWKCSTVSRPTDFSLLPAEFYLKLSPSGLQGL